MIPAQILPKTTSISGSNSRPISIDVFLNYQEQLLKPVVIFCHGYKGFKDWGCWNLVAEEFANEGFNFVKFNFSHNGVTPDNPLDFEDLEAFGNNNYSKELFDLEAVLDWVVSDENEFEQFFDSTKIYVIGHSRGGGIASLAAAKNIRIAKTVTWASVCNLTQRLPKNIQEWKENGVVYELNGRTNQEMPLFFQFYENTQMNKNELDIEKQGKRITNPFCIIHGTKDTAVTVEEAEKLHDAVPHSQLILIENAGHTFGSSHPYLTPDLPPDLKKVVGETIEFLKQKKFD